MDDNYDSFPDMPEFLLDDSLYEKLQARIRRNERLPRFDETRCLQVVKTTLGALNGNGIEIKLHENNVMEGFAEFEIVAYDSQFDYTLFEGFREPRNLVYMDIKKLDDYTPQYIQEVQKAIDVCIFSQRPAHLRRWINKLEQKIQLYKLRKS